MIGQRIRDHCAVLALKDMCDWFAQGGQAAIYDATNRCLLARQRRYAMCLSCSTRERRKLVSDYLRQHPNFTGELVHFATCFW